MINIWTWRDEISGFIIIVRIATRGRRKTCLCHSFKKHQITFDITHDIIKISYHTFHREKLFIVTFLIKKKKTCTRIPCAGLLLYLIHLETIELIDEINWGSILSFLTKKLPPPKKIKCVGVGGFVYNIHTSTGI